MSEVRQAAILAAEARIVAANPTPEPVAPVVEEAAPEVEAPPATEPPAAVVEDHDEEHEDSAASDDGADPTAPRKNKGVGKRINELTREKHEERRAREQAEADAAYWRAQAQQVQQPQRQPEPVQSQGKPTLEQFGYDQEAYTDALTDWKVGEALKSREQQYVQRQAQQEAEKRVMSLKERENSFVEEHPDYYDIAHNPRVPISGPMVEAILESEIAPAIGYHLGKNLALAEQISRMTPFAAARAIGRIEAELSAPKPLPPRPTVTRAPPPPPAVSGANAVPARLTGIEDHIAVVRAKRKANHG